MSVAGRFWNFVKGLFWQGQRNLEQSNPEAVYEMAIRKMKSNYQQMHTAVGRLAAERNRLRNLIEQKSDTLAEVERDPEAALAEAAAGNPDAQELGEDLINEKEALEGEIGQVRGELSRSEPRVEDEEPRVAPRRNDRRAQERGGSQGLRRHDERHEHERGGVRGQRHRGLHRRRLSAGRHLGRDEWGHPRREAPQAARVSACTGQQVQVSGHVGGATGQVRRRWARQPRDGEGWHRLVQAAWTCSGNRDPRVRRSQDSTHG